MLIAIAKYIRSVLPILLPGKLYNHAIKMQPLLICNLNFINLESYNKLMKQFSNNVPNEM